MKPFLLLALAFLLWLTLSGGLVTLNRLLHP